jgi:ribonucleoside-diphosphate reductase alpha chain
MRIERRYTETGKSPYAGIEFRTTTSEIRNPDGSVVFQLKDIEVPADWSQVACDVLAQKYFRKAGIPQRLKPVTEADMPVWLCRHAPDGPRCQPRSCPAHGRETKATRVFDRLAGTWTCGAGRAAISTAGRRPQFLRRDAL